MSMNPQAASTQSIASILGAYGSGNVPVGDLSETYQAVESIKSVRFAFHPWMDFPNFGADTFRFNIPYPTLKRLEMIALPALPRAVITPKRGPGSFAFGSVTVGGEIPSQGSTSNVTQAMQMPAESIADLLMAYRKFGMAGLDSLTAHDESTLIDSFTVFGAVMGVARDEYEEENFGRRHAELVLEDYPAWLRGGAPLALETAINHGFTLHGRELRLNPSLRERGLQLIGEIEGSIALAHEMALNPSDGILPNAKNLLNVTANRGAGGKAYLDPVEEWLLAQFPSFKMDTDVERAKTAMQEALKGSSSNNNDIITVISKLQEASQGQQATLDLLAQFLVSQQQQNANQPTTQGARAPRSAAKEL